MLLDVVIPMLAQSPPWEQVGEYKGANLEPAKLSRPEMAGIAKLIVARGEGKGKDSGWYCDAGELQQGAKWETIAISTSHQVVLVEAGTCARGGQGSNGAMWLVRVDGSAPVLLAPAGALGGWIYSIQNTLSYGYRDIVLGWHMSAAESGLNYLRFDGKQYKSIGSATSLRGDDGNTKIIPENRERQ